MRTTHTSERSVLCVRRLAYHSGPDAPLTRRRIPAVNESPGGSRDINGSSTGSTVVPATNRRPNAPRRPSRFSRLDFAHVWSAWQSHSAGSRLPQTSRTDFRESFDDLVSRSPLPCRAEPTPRTAHRHLETTAGSPLVHGSAITLLATSNTEPSPAATSRPPRHLRPSHPLLYRRPKRQHLRP